MSKRGYFITFEGTDGVGKTTQIRLLKSWFIKKGLKVQLTREPGGGPLAEKIRKILLNPHNKIEDLTELFLYFAARIEHIKKVIKPSLERGQIVLCDRFTDATVAYQGFARGISIDIINKLNQIATNGIKPHLTLWLDLPPKIGLKNAQSRFKGGKGDRLEQEGVNFQKKVREGYHHIAMREPGRFKRVSVEEEISDTQNKIRLLVEKHLKI